MNNNNNIPFQKNYINFITKEENIKDNLIEFQKGKINLKEIIILNIVLPSQKMILIYILRIIFTLK